MMWQSRMETVASGSRRTPGRKSVAGTPRPLRTAPEVLADGWMRDWTRKRTLKFVADGLVVVGGVRDWAGTAAAGGGGAKD